MSRISLSLVLNESTTRQSLNQELTKQLRSLFLAKKSIIVTDIKKIIRASLVGSEVFAGLLGGFPNDPEKDLQAHFGLTNIEALSITKNMVDVAMNSVKDTVFIGSGKNLFVIEIVAVENSFADFLSIPGGSFTSSPSNKEVPWMTWLLINPLISIDQAFGIVFQQGLRPSEVGKSRSGRALMKKLGVLSNSGQLVTDPYAVPTLGRPQGKINFIVDVLNKGSVKQAIIKIFQGHLGLKRG